MGFPTSMFVEELNSVFVCTICQDVQDSPISCGPCGHTFCERCIDAWVYRSSNHTCPTCRVTLCPKYDPDNAEDDSDDEDTDRNVDDNDDGDDSEDDDDDDNDHVCPDGECDCEFFELHNNRTIQQLIYNLPVQCPHHNEDNVRASAGQQVLPVRRKRGSDDDSVEPDANNRCRRPCQRRRRNEAGKSEDIFRGDSTRCDEDTAASILMQISASSLSNNNSSNVEEDEEDAHVAGVSNRNSTSDASTSSNSVVPSSFTSASCCSWTGTLRDYELYHKDQCLFGTITCSVPGCFHFCQRKDMDQHLASPAVQLRHQKLLIQDERHKILTVVKRSVDEGVAIATREILQQNQQAIENQSFMIAQNKWRKQIAEFGWEFFTGALHYLKTKTGI